MKVYNKDCFELLSSIKSNSISLIHTDVPYYITENGITKSGESGYNWASKDKKWDEQWSSLQDYRKWLKRVVKELIRVCKPERHIVIWCNIRDISTITDVAIKLGCTINPIWVWQKSNPVPQAAGVTPKKDIEVAVWLVKGARKQKWYNKKCGAITQTIRCSIPREEGSSIRHPSQKPLFLSLIINLFLTKSNSKVLDPFAGTGSIGITANYIGCDVTVNDIGIKYYKAIKKRNKNILDVANNVYDYLTRLGGNKKYLRKRLKMTGLF